MEDKEVQENLNKIQETVEESLQQSVVEELIHNESMTYVFKDTTYKVVKVNFKQKQEIYKAIAKKKIGFLETQEFLPTDVLKRKWLKNGIDIDSMEKSIADLSQEKAKVQEQLGLMLTEENQYDNYKSFETKIKSIDNEINIIRSKIFNYLDCSIETQTDLFAYMYTAYVSTLKLDGEEFVQAWKSFDEFEQEDEKLIGVLSLYASVLSRDEINL